MNLSSAFGLFLLLFSLQTVAAEQCANLFAKELKFSKQGKLAQSEIERIQDLDVKIQETLTLELSKLNANEIDLIRIDATKIQNEISSITHRIALNSELNGSDRLRIDVESSNKAKRWLFKLKSGAVDSFVSRTGPFFSLFEVTYLRINELEKQINILQSSKNLNSQYVGLQIELKKKEMLTYEKFIGKNYFNYFAIRQVINQTAKSKIANQTIFANEALLKLRHVSNVEAAEYKLPYADIKLQEINDFLISNKNANKAMLQRAVWEERWMTVKLLLMSGPAIEFTKKVLYKVPATLKGLPIRDWISDFLGLSYNQHVRDIYLERLEEIADLDLSTNEQFERLRTLNSISERPDELLVLFARIPENTESWYAIKKLAEKKKASGAIYQNFYERLEIAEKKAIENGEFSIYYQEAGMSQVMKIGLGAWATISVIHYNPGLIESLFSMVQAPFKVFGF